MAPYDRSRTMPIVTITLSCIIFEIKRDNGRKSQFSHTPRDIMFGTQKLEWLFYEMWKSSEMQVRWDAI